MLIIFDSQTGEMKNLMYIDKNGYVSEDEVNGFSVNPITIGCEEYRVYDNAIMQQVILAKQERRTISLDASKELVIQELITG